MAGGLSDDIVFEIKYEGKKKDCIERGKAKEVGPSLLKALVACEMLASIHEGFSLCVDMYVCNICTSVCSRK